MKPKIKAAIFDFDGIIISSKVAEYESWKRVFTGVAVAILQPGLYLQLLLFQ
jgi:beta-phosphoglucomutase-like phosphatase (HAD superfamily)